MAGHRLCLAAIRGVDMPGRRRPDKVVRRRAFWKLPFDRESRLRLPPLILVQRTIRSRTMQRVTQASAKRSATVLQVEPHPPQRGGRRHVTRLELQQHVNPDASEGAEKCQTMCAIRRAPGES